MTGEELLRLRTKHNLTTRELATAIGVFQPRIVNWENNKHKISPAYVKILTDYFNKLEKGIQP
jgi:transcriptional regulator with XRE-family HTH domain